MATRKTYTFRTDVSRSIIRDSKNQPLGANDIVFVLGDGLLLRFYFELTEDEGQTYSAFPIPPTGTLKFMVKDPEKITLNEALISADVDQWNLAGDWSALDVLQGKCSVRVSCATDALRTFLASSGKEIKTGRAEVVLLQPGEDDVTLVQFDVGLRNDVIRGAEGVPMALGPALATQAYVDHKTSQLLRPDGGRIDLTNGTMTLWDDELQAWITYGSKNGQFVRITP